MAELNPGHPVTRAVRDQADKFLVCVLWKYRDVLPADVVITKADVDALVDAFPDMPTIIYHDQKDGMHLKVVSLEEGRAQMRKETERG